MQWRTIGRPGYFGEKRNELQIKWNEQFGEENWRIAWQWGNPVIGRAEALQMYEDGYYEFFKGNSSLLSWLVNFASNICDTSPTNVQAGFSYDIQETPNNHIHDVAIRRAVLRNGVWFSGDKLLEVRSVDAKGWVLSPCNIPFHLPQLFFVCYPEPVFLVYDKESQVFEQEVFL